MGGQIILISAVAAITWYGGAKVIHGVEHVTHATKTAIHKVFRHHHHKDSPK